MDEKIKYHGDKNHCGGMRYCEDKDYNSKDFKCRECFNDAMEELENLQVNHVIMECKKCKRPFVAYKGMSISIEDKPCPYCNKENKKV